MVDAKGPMNVDMPSLALATKGDQDPQWLSNLQRDGVSVSWGDCLRLVPLMGLVRCRKGRHRQEYAKSAGRY